MATSLNYEKSRKNPALLHHILNDPLANLWESTVDKPCLVEVAEHSLEYMRINALFSSTARGMTIKKLQRVENPYLLGHFILKREKMKQSGVSVQESWLFHGTRSSYVDGICVFNFDWRKCGTSRGHKFGRGVSFTPEVSYARHYTPNNVMILAKVLKGNAICGNMLTVIPPSGYDTTRNVPGSVFVKYDDDDFYPQYVIHFNR